MKQNTPDREVQGVMCLLARDTDAFATEATRTQFLTRRGVPTPPLRPDRLALLRGAAS